jgi:RNA polymerase sigma factor (sigma-70 family)
VLSHARVKAVDDRPVGELGADGARPPSDGDAALIVGSLTDPERFGEIYDRYVAYVHRYVSRRVGGVLADDLAADTFLEAFRGRHRYDSTAACALPWLYGIATNLLRRHWREERAQYRAWERAGADPMTTESHDEAVASKVTAAALAGTLARLTARERDVLFLVVWGELSYAETATALDIPVGTVRSRLNRARMRLRTAMDYPPQPKDAR